MSMRIDTIEGMHVVTILVDSRYIREPIYVCILTNMKDRFCQGQISLWPIGVEILSSVFVGN